MSMVFSLECHCHSGWRSLRMELNNFEISSTTELTLCGGCEETRVYSIGHEAQAMQALPIYTD